MSRPWMPLYVADYLADTSHLRAAQSGAYIHLIMHYWQHGGLPSDDAQLAAITRMSDLEWRKARPLIETFFQEGWKHKRVDEELAKSLAKYELRAAAGRAGGNAKTNGKQSASNAAVLPEQTPSKPEANFYQPQPQPQPQPPSKASAPLSADAPERGKSLISQDAFAICDEVLKAMGKEAGDPTSIGAPMQIQAWLNGGWPREAILAGVEKAMTSRRGKAPETLRYFEKGIAQAYTDFTRQLPIVTTNETPETNHATPRADHKQRARNIIQAADRLVDTIRSFDDGAAQPERIRGGTGTPDVRLLSQG
jgi:uncharacterized protein YdaU (DUF1376 family)